MNRRAPTAQVAAVLALGLGAGALAPLTFERASAEEPAHLHLRQLAAADLGEAGATAGLEAAWRAAAKPALVATGEPQRYQRADPPRIWQVPPQEGLPQGATVVDGVWVDAPLCEAERYDVRVVALGVGERLGATVTLPPNAGSPTVQVIGFRGVDELLLLLRGAIWRGGSYLEVLRWRPATAQVERLYSVAGEEETTPSLSYALEGGRQPRVVVHGLAGGAPAVLSFAPARPGRVTGGGPAVLSPPAGR